MGTSHQSIMLLPPCIPLRHYCMMFLAFNAPSSAYLPRRFILLASKTNRIVAGLLQLIETAKPTE